MNVFMTMLQREASAGFPGLAGARLHGSVPLSQRVINDALRQVRGVPPGFALEVQPDRRLMVRYGLVHARAVLDPEVRMTDGGPQITLDLASTVLAWTLSQALRLKGVRIAGRRVTIDLGALDGLEAYRHYWRHLERVQLQTTAGRLHVDIALAVR